jgi:hypothetical protein
MALVKLPPRLPVVNNEAPPQSSPVHEKAKRKSSGKKKGPRKIDDTTEIDFDELNTTELLALSKMVGIPGASSAASRAVLVDALTNLKPIIVPNPVEETKVRLIQWMKRYWHKIRMQTPENVFDLLQQSDFQVAFFYLKNRDQMT